MSAGTWLIIGIAAFSLAGVMFFISIFLFVTLKIPSVIGDLTGRTVAKEIEMIRLDNAAGMYKRFRPSPVNRERGTITEPVDNEELETALPTDVLSGATESLSKTTEVLSENTTVLDTDNATTLLVDEAENDMTFKMTRSIEETHTDEVIE